MRFPFFLLLSPCILFTPGKLKAETKLEVQYWTYALEDGRISFRFPWEHDGNGDAVFDESRVPEYGRTCSQKARERFHDTFQRSDLLEQFERLHAKGVTSRFTLIVNVIPSRNFLNQLRRWDRDAYFWHWNGRYYRPALSMSQFRQGTWVWEVIAYPGTCLQPQETEIRRFLDYVEKRVNQP